MAREENGIHTCDKRRTRSYISSTFPLYDIDASLSEDDELWRPDIRETKRQVADRAKAVLERVWEERMEDECV